MKEILLTLSSLLLHFAIYNFIVSQELPEAEPAPIYLELTEPKSSSRMRTLVNSDSQANAKLTPEAAKFVSERDQRVLQQSVQRLKSEAFRLQSRAGSKQVSPETSPQENRPREKLGALTDPDGVAVKNITPQFDYSEIMPQAGAQSRPMASNPLVPSGIKFGNFTALNTDRFQFYSFYSRLESLVYPRWSRRTWDVIQARGVQRKSREPDWVNLIEVVLDEKGKFLRGFVHEASRVEAFDSESIAAFREVSLFPNPPREMVRADGTIRIYGRFEVHFDPRYAGSSD